MFKVSFSDRDLLLVPGGKAAKFLHCYRKSFRLSVGMITS